MNRDELLALLADDTKEKPGTLRRLQQALTDSEAWDDAIHDQNIERDLAALLRDTSAQRQSIMQAIREEKVMKAVRQDATRPSFPRQRVPRIRSGRSGRGRSRAIIAAGAGAMLVSILAWFIFRPVAPAAQTWHQQANVHTNQLQPGDQIASGNIATTLTYSDQSQLTLNPNSRLRWLSETEGAALEQGRLTANITPQGREQFHIQAGQQSIRVKGTIFDLAHNGTHMRLAVREGRVQVRSGNRAPTLLDTYDLWYEGRILRPTLWKWNQSAGKPKRLQHGRMSAEGYLLPTLDTNSTTARRSIGWNYKWREGDGAPIIIKPGTTMTLDWRSPQLVNVQVMLVAIDPMNDKWYGNIITTINEVRHQDWSQQLLILDSNQTNMRVANNKPFDRPLFIESILIMVHNPLAADLAVREISFTP